MTDAKTMTVIGGMIFGVLLQFTRHQLLSLFGYCVASLHAEPVDSISIVTVDTSGTTGQSKVYAK